MKNNSALAIARLYNEWLDESVNYKSGCTIRSYETSVTSFIGYLVQCKQQKIDGFCTEDAFSAENIKNWMLWIKNEMNIKPQSCNVRLSNLRAFLKFISKKDIRYASTYLASKDVDLLKTEKVQIRSLTREAIKTLLSIPDTKTFTGMRDIVLMSLMYTTGCRINEALSIKLADLHIDNKPSFMSVLGKGNKRRTPYLSSVMVQNIKVYLKKYFSLSSDNERYLFYSNYKGQFCKLSQEAIRKQLTKYVQVAHRQSKDVPLEFHTHQFRHSMSVHRLEDDMNIVQLSKELGHARIETTMVSLDVVPGKKEQAIAELESENVKSLPRKWESQAQKLNELFKRRH
jgi:integrase/recombinase XerD